jgi:hypothetical protein
MSAWRQDGDVQMPRAVPNAKGVGGTKKGTAATRDNFLRLDSQDLKTQTIEHSSPARAQAFHRARYTRGLVGGRSPSYGFSTVDVQYSVFSVQT